MSNSFGIEFEGLDAMVDELMNIEGALPMAATEALEETHKIITPKAQAAIAAHSKTGGTAASLNTSPSVKWEGALVASIEAGFAISKGGLASVFLMWGTPRMAPDPAFHDAFYGQDEAIAEAQRAAFEKVLVNG